MLYNKNWNKPIVYDVRSIDSLIEWLETKDPNEAYNYGSSNHCLCAQYFKAKGYWFVKIYPHKFYHGMVRSERLPTGFDQIASNGPHIFGYALQRARDYQYE